MTTHSSSGSKRKGHREFDPLLLEHLADLRDASAVIHQGLDLARELALRWSVDIEGWLSGATTSLVLAGRRNGSEVALRLPLRTWEDDVSLPATLAFSGHGGVPVLESDEATGATLMPRLRPGDTLEKAPEPEALEACADLILRLRHADGAGQSVAQYIRSVFERHPLPSRLRPELAGDAARVARRLLDTSPPPRLLHGDLHHFNILRDGQEWVAIDPEGLAGDPAYECAAFIRNPVPSVADRDDLPELLRRRIERLAERTGDPPDRIWGWAYVRTRECVAPSGGSPFQFCWTEVLATLDDLRGEYGVALLSS